MRSSTCAVAKHFLVVQGPFQVSRASDSCKVIMQILIRYLDFSITVYLWHQTEDIFWSDFVVTMSTIYFDSRKSWLTIWLCSSPIMPLQQQRAKKSVILFPIDIMVASNNDDGLYFCGYSQITSRCRLLIG